MFLHYNSTDRNDDFLDVMDAVFTLAADWEKIAMKLHLRYDTISAIQKDNPGDTHACLEKAISQWLKENYNIAKFGVPSWRTLVTAVETIDIGLANDIAESHKGIQVGIFFFVGGGLNSGSKKMCKCGHYRFSARRRGINLSPHIHVTVTGRKLR